MIKHALIVIDVQLDFCQGGALAVPHGDEVIDPINTLIAEHDHVILTQDWHPAHHSSFASQHEDCQPFSQIKMEYGMQTLWPDHCVQGSRGAEFHPQLNQTKAELIIRKGFDAKIDSYSAFFENDRKSSTGLAGYLNARGITSIVMAGLATDFCVAFSALDAVRLGLDCKVILPACRGINLDGSYDQAIAQMQKAGVNLS